MNLMNLLGGWQIKLAAIVIVLVALFGWHKYEVKVAVNAAVTQIEQQYARETFRLKDKAQNETYALQEKIDKQAKEKDAKIKAISGKYNDLLVSVQSRPDRSPSSTSVSTNASTTGSIQGATGMQLSRPDAEFLIWFARDTAKLQAELISCQSDYNAAKETQDKFRKDNASKQ